MNINPPPVKFIIFSGGGGLIERAQKVHLVPGTNRFEIENVPAAFDPSTTMVYFPDNPADVSLQQIDVRRPDKLIVDNFINKEKQAANNIIQNATDLRGTNRDSIIQMIESAHYRRYEDMAGSIVASIESKKHTEIMLAVKYFIEDSRIKWEPSLHIKVNEEKGTADIEGFMLVMNNTDQTYPRCELGFAEFEVKSSITDDGYLEDLGIEQAAQNLMPKPRMMQKFKRVKNVMF